MTESNHEHPVHEQAGHERELPPRGASRHLAQQSVVTEVDLTSHSYPISRVAWREADLPAGRRH